MISADNGYQSSKTFINCQSVELVCHQPVALPSYCYSVTVRCDAGDPHYFRVLFWLHLGRSVSVSSVRWQRCLCVHRRCLRYAGLFVAVASKWICLIYVKQTWRSFHDHYRKFHVEYWPSIDNISTIATNNNNKSYESVSANDWLGYGNDRRGFNQFGPNDTSITKIRVSRLLFAFAWCQLQLAANANRWMWFRHWTMAIQLDAEKWCGAHRFGRVGSSRCAESATNSGTERNIRHWR